MCGRGWHWDSCRRLASTKQTKASLQYVILTCGFVSKSDSFSKANRIFESVMESEFSQLITWWTHVRALWGTGSEWAPVWEHQWEILPTVRNIADKKLQSSVCMFGSMMGGSIPHHSDNLLTAGWKIHSGFHYGRDEFTFSLHWRKEGITLNDETEQMQNPENVKSMFV